MTFLNDILNMLSLTAPYWILFLGTFLLALILTPLVRSMNRRLGMVDVPSARRINKTPIPRGGGVAVILSFAVTTAVFVLFSGKPISPAIKDQIYWRMLILRSKTRFIGGC